MTSNARSWWIRVAALAFIPASALVCLLACELVLRLTGFGYPPGFFVPLGTKDLQVTNERFGWRFFPRAMARTPDVERLGVKPPRTFRIVVLGESAAMGFPEPAFSFGRVLEVLLEQNYPELDVEVVNAAMTAINSHVILPIARDAGRLAPDLFVVYAGNNEVVGPYGPGTVFTASMPMPLIRFHVWQTGTRFGQTVASFWSGRQAPATWRGMEMFLDRRVPANAPALKLTYSHFRYNLIDILAVAERAGARVILSTMATNLADCPPFASEAGELRSAEAHFRLARRQLAAGDVEAGRRNARLARDLDTLRFRADSGINGVIRDVAKGSPEVVLADAEREFDLASRAGVPGNNFFYEHAHLNFAGNYLLAQTVAAKIPPAWLQAAPRPAWPSIDDIARRLAYTPWDEARMAAKMVAMMERAPFTNQIGHPVDSRARRDALAELRVRAGFADSRKVYETALAARPDDLHIRARYADLLRDQGQFALSAREWQRLVELVPGRKVWHASLAAALTDAGRFADADREYHHALEADREFDLAWFGLGVLAARQGRYSEAAENYRHAIAIHPGYAEAHSNLGAALAAAGKTNEAMDQYRRAVELAPDLPSARYNMAAALIAAGRGKEAAPHLEAALRSQPGHIDARFALADLCAQEGQLEAAAAHYREALARRPESPDGHYNLGVVLSRAGKLEEATEQYAAALRLRPSWPEAHNNFGTALAKQGRLRQAAEHFRKALELRPDFTPARANLERTVSSVR